MIGEHTGTYLRPNKETVIIVERWYKWNKGKPFPTQVDIYAKDKIKSYPIEMFLTWLNERQLVKIK